MNIMLDYGQKRKVRSVMYHKATLVILAVLVLVMARSTWIVYQKKISSEEMKNVSLQNVEELRSRNNDLTAKIERLGTQTGIEEEIRSKFSVVKEKENMVVVVEDQNSEISTTSPKTGLWNLIKSFFTGRR